MQKNVKMKYLFYATVNTNGYIKKKSGHVRERVTLAAIIYE